MTKYVGGVDIHKKYTIHEVMDMWYAGKLRPIGLNGYLPRASSDGICEFVPWWKTDAFSQEQNGMRVFASEDDVFGQMKADVEHEHPIVRRTPQQRVAAMLMR